jgi:Zn-dependent protease with chaperone function
MILVVALGAVLVAAFAASAPRLARPLPPRTATYLLVAGAVASTGTALGLLALMALTAIAQLPPVAFLGEWSRPVLRSSDPVPVWLAVCCAGLLVPLALLGLRHALRRARAFMRLHRECRDLGPVRRLGEAPNVVVLDSEHPEAFTTPAGGGRIIVTRGLLRALPADEQRVLLAHEAAHLRHRHTWWVLGAQLCAAVNPALGAVARATTHAVERWADESAAAVVGDRRLAARALARAALHVNAARRENPVTVGVLDGEVPRRVQALLAPPARPRLGVTVGLVLMLVATLGCATVAQRRTDAFLDLASTDRPPAGSVSPRPGLRVRAGSSRSGPAASVARTGIPVRGHIRGVEGGRVGRPSPRPRPRRAARARGRG